MFVGGQASLVITSDIDPIDPVTALLETEPTRAWNKGDVVNSNSVDRPIRFRPRSLWDLTFESDPHEDNSAGEVWLDRLIAFAESRRKNFGLVRERYDVVIYWSATLDNSGQGSFIFSPDLLQRLAALDCEVVGWMDHEDEIGEENPNEATTGSGATRGA